MLTATTDAFLEAWRKHNGHAPSVAAELNLQIRSVYGRRASLERMGHDLPAGQAPRDNVTHRQAYTTRLVEEIEDGTAAVFGDRHWWPGDGITAAEAALLALLPQLDPDILVCNGDELDGARQGRHGSLGWEKKPGMDEELAAVQVGLGRIADAAQRARKYRTIGNHTRRYDYHLSRHAPDYRGIRGMRLRDHLPDWQESWSLHVNPGTPGGHAVIKHMIGNGVTAARTNAIKSGVTIVTGHTHRLDAHPIETYAGRHWGVQCGLLAHPRAPAFEYAEDPPDAGCAGFAVLTWRSGILQPPEFCEVDAAGVAWWRGEPVTIKPRVRVQAGRG